MSTPLLDMEPALSHQSLTMARITHDRKAGGSKTSDYRTGKRPRKICMY